MTQRKRKAPAYQLHKRTGQARVRIDGKDHYLGRHGSAESRERYRQFMRQWRAAQDGLVSTIADIVDDCMPYALSYYRKNGKPTSANHSIRGALRFLKPYHAEFALEFGPKKLESARDAMADAGIHRKSINQDLGRIRRLLRWAVSEELRG